MIREVKFESQDRRMKQILAALNKHGIKDIEEANQICESYGIDPYMECESTQMICFENAKWAYVVGTAIALKEKAKDAVEAAEYIGEGLQGQHLQQGRLQRKHFVYVRIQFEGRARALQC